MPDSPRQDSPELLTTAQVAEHLGISVRRVQVLIRSGRLPAIRLGRDYLIDPASLTLPTVVHRPPGRPFKTRH